MPTLLAKLLLLLLALTIVIPESYAKRAGSGRSVGRQAGVVRQQRPATPPPAPPAMSRAQPAPPPQRQQPVPPSSAARQDNAPLTPERTLPQQARSPWGGILGGALIGLGLGSLLGGDRDANAANQSEGSSGAGTGNAASGTGDEQAQPAQAQRSGFGSFWLWGILAAVVIYLVRRARNRRR
ncbi:MAG TPA: hypothetical protein VEC01_18305 [Noviherbaspirillum sp.]|uniref:hypothetical protein n=1 Tax=Noviherbaspirillum sp. TaxID=1926288 RepID=UPI002D30A6CE|nr:hypothetical protein [Noviherbaspirillum sp.]HYD97283.1 hypothetical protein [Noviherbaspirillum sp.]